MRTQRTVALAVIVIMAIVGLSGLMDAISQPIMGLIMVIGAAVLGLTTWQSMRALEAQASVDEADHKLREEKAQAVRATLEREQAFYDLTSTLSRTLDHTKVLEAVQSIGELISRNKDGRVVSAVYLFDEDNGGQLHVFHARGLTRKDEEHRTPGQQGVLGLALKQSEPVFAGWARRDPELQYYVGFQECQSVIALPLSAGYHIYGVLVFGSTQKDAFSAEYSDLLKAIGTQATISLQNAELYQKILLEKERIVEVEEDARKKLARDLHDGPTQNVSAIAMRLDYIARLLDREKTKDAIEEIHKIEDIARRTTKDIRHMLFTLRPLILETQGLVVALKHLAEKNQETYSLNVIVDAQDGVERLLDNNAQGIVFYIIEEAVNNARKHAQSQHVWIRLYQRDHLFVSEVEDDGVGFSDKEIKAGFNRNSLGMTNMRERSELVEGTFDISSQEGVGTKIILLIPIRQEALMVNQRTEGGLPPQAPRVSRLRELSPTQPKQPFKLIRGKTRPKIPLPYADKQSPSN